MEESLNIIIFSDFAVFSSLPKDTTLGWLRKSNSFLTHYHGSFSICFPERILIHISNTETPISKIQIQSNLSLDSTIDVLERVTDLLQYNGTDFFCPDESF